MNGDVVKEKADILVNTANSNLFHDGGLSAIFAKHTGKSIHEESQVWINQWDRVPVGGCAVTKAGNMQNTQLIIHVVGPDYRSNVKDS